MKKFCNRPLFFVSLGMLCLVISILIWYFKLSLISLITLVYDFQVPPEDSQVPPEWWYQQNYQPTFTCQHERRIGGLGDGPKWVCDPHRIPRDSCLVYSIGSNNDFSFEQSVLNEISDKCEIHTFDPTTGKNPSNKPPSVHFHPWAVGSKTEVNKLGWEVKTIQDIISSLGHNDRTIDILKIDCEGCEWESYDTWLNGPKIRQIQVKLYGIKKAKELLSSAYNSNFVVFHIEPDAAGKCQADCYEFAFLRLSNAFFSEDIRSNTFRIPAPPPRKPFLDSMLAYKESDGFFTDIRDSDWLRMKERQRNAKYCNTNVRCGKK